MKKTTCFLLCLLLVCALVPAAHAAVPKVVDDADLLTDGETAALEKKAQALADEYDMDVVIVTVWSLDGKTSEAYADDYFDYYGYGIGEDHSGVLLLVSMEYRDWAISTCGDTIYALTDYGIQQLASEFLGYLSDGDYYWAFDTYLDALEPYFESYLDGTPIDGTPGDYEGPGTYEPGTKDDVIYYPEREMEINEIISRVLVSLLFGVVAAIIALLVMRSKMNTAKAQKGAGNYVVGGSFQLRQRRDIFLYSRVSKVRRSESSSGGGGGSRGGGSSTHRSSSGRSHGGGHGKF